MNRYSEWNKKYYQENKIKISIQRKKYYEDNKETLKEKKKIYFLKNRENNCTGPYQAGGFETYTP